jgi:hypothetical protein
MAAAAQPQRRESERLADIAAAAAARRAAEQQRQAAAAAIAAADAQRRSAAQAAAVRLPTAAQQSLFGGGVSVGGGARSLSSRNIPVVTDAEIAAAERARRAAAWAQQVADAEIARVAAARAAVAERAQVEAEVAEHRARDGNRDIKLMAVFIMFFISMIYFENYNFQPFRETSVETGDDLDLLQQALNVLKNKIGTDDFSRIQNILTKIEQKDSSATVDINKYNSELKQRYPEYEKLKDLKMVEIRSQIKKFLKKTDKTNLNFRSKKSKKSKSKSKKSKSKKSKSKTKSKSKKSKTKKSLRKVRK